MCFLYQLIYLIILYIKILRYSYKKLICEIFYILCQIISEKSIKYLELF